MRSAPRLQGEASRTAGSERKHNEQTGVVEAKRKHRRSFSREMTSPIKAMNQNYGFPMTPEVEVRVKLLHGNSKSKPWTTVANMLIDYRLQETKARALATAPMPPPTPDAPKTSPPGPPSHQVKSSPLVETHRDQSLQREGKRTKRSIGKSLSPARPRTSKCHDTSKQAPAPSRRRKRSMSWNLDPDEPLPVSEEPLPAGGDSTSSVEPEPKPQLSVLNLGRSESAEPPMPSAPPASPPDSRGLKFPARTETAPARLMTRKKRHSKSGQYFKGVGEGIAGVPLGVMNGLAGIISEPVRSVKKSGPLGLLRGVGHAITGVVRTPLQAVADLTDRVAGDEVQERGQHEHESMKRGSLSSTGTVTPSMGERREKRAFPGKSFLLGVAGLGKGLVFGVSGVFTEPVRMARKQGVTGFFRGVRSGLVGVVGQPVKGVVKFLEGIDKTFAAETNNEPYRIGDWNTFRRIAKYGVPSDLRPAFWEAASGARASRRASGLGYFQKLVAGCSALHDALANALELAKTEDIGDALAEAARDSNLSPAERLILKDLDRTYPEHPWLGAPEGFVALANVLGAYARRNPEVGYCQGLNFVAGIALAVLGSQEAAFWIMVALTENVLPVGYHDRSLAHAAVDSAVLRALVSWKQSRVARHLSQHGVPLESCVTHWFVALFSNALPPHTVIRIWDLLFIRGRIMVHEVALALLDLNKKKILAQRDPGRLFNILATLGSSDVGVNDVALLKRASSYRLSAEKIRTLVSQESKALAARYIEDFGEEGMNSGGGEGLSGGHDSLEENEKSLAPAGGEVELERKESE